MRHCFAEDNKAYADLIWLKNSVEGSFKSYSYKTNLVNSNKSVGGENGNQFWKSDFSYLGFHIVMILYWTSKSSNTIHSVQPEVYISESLIAEVYIFCGAQFSGDSLETVRKL